MATQKWIRRDLESRGIRFMELHHRDTPTSQMMAQQEHVSGHRVAKVVVAMVDGQPVELVLPASRHVDLELLRELFQGREVRLASEVEIERHFGDCEVGAIPPLRHWQGIDVVMDRSMDVEGDILFPAGTHTDAIRLRFRDWYDLVTPQVAAFATAP
ncbi:MAG: YbaK/EbsC family protein [Gemmataceae bacterium]